MKIKSKPDPNKYLIIIIEGRTYKLIGERTKDGFLIDSLRPSVYIWEPLYEYGLITDESVHSELIRKAVEQTENMGERIILK